MTEKATFAHFESSSGAGVHRIPLEVFPNFWAYAYIVQKDEYCVLIDSGSGTDSSHENLVAGLHQVELVPSDLTHILLTHAHIDHFGGLSRLRPITAAKFGVHELDAQTVTHHEASSAFVGRRLASFLAETGLAEEARDQIFGIHLFTTTMQQSVPVDFTYETADMHLGPFAFIHLPGHCPGHVAIRLDDVIFCGDMIVEGITPHLIPESIIPYSGLGHYLDSLARLQSWAKDARLVLNGHDEAITHLPSQIESTKQNIVRRISKAIDALHEPLTIEEVCRAVYGEMGGYSQLLVIEKTGAYVEYLYQHGMIGIINPNELEQGKSPRYQRLQEENLILEELARSVGMYTSAQVDA